MPRRPTVLLLCAAIVAATLSLASPASAVTTSVHVTGSAQLGASTTAPARISYGVAVTGRIANAQLDANVFDSAPVDVSSVQFDGVTVAPGTVSIAGTRLTVRIGDGADSVNGGVLTTGTHVVSYTQLPPDDAGKYPTTSATLYYDLDGAPGSAASAAVQLAHPDLVVSSPAGSAVEPLGTGRSAGFPVVIANPGPSAAATTVTVTLPAGLRIDPDTGVLRYDPTTDTGTRLSCTGATTVSCAFGAVAHGSRAFLVVAVEPLRTATPGTQASLRVTVSPTGQPDQAPGDNSVSGRLRYTGVAVLHYSLTPATTKVKLGHTVRIALRVTNDGPQPAAITIGLAVVEPVHFTITGYSTADRVPGPDMFRIPLGGKYGGAVLWNVGTVAPHHTVTAQLTLKAVDAGPARVVFYGQSASANPACDAARPTCDQSSQVRLTAVK